MVVLDEEQLSMTSGDGGDCAPDRRCFQALPCAKHHNGFAMCANQFFVFQLF
jgi:hypothetical protein